MWALLQGCPFLFVRPPAPMLRCCRSCGFAHPSTRISVTSKRRYCLAKPCCRAAFRAERARRRRLAAPRWSLEEALPVAAPRPSRAGCPGAASDALRTRSCKLASWGRMPLSTASYSRSSAVLIVLEFALQDAQAARLRRCGRLELRRSSESMTRTRFGVKTGPRASAAPWRPASPSVCCARCTACALGRCACCTCNTGSARLCRWPASCQRHSSRTSEDRSAG